MADDFIKPSEDDDEIIQLPDPDEEGNTTLDENEDNEDKEEAEQSKEVEDSEDETVDTEDTPVNEVTKQTVTEKIIVKTSKDKPDKNSKDDKKEKDQKSDEIAPENGEKPEGKLKKLWHKFLAKKKITIPITILLVVLLLMTFPFTRYTIVGVFIKKTVTVKILDQTTGKPVSEADVTIAGKTAKSDGSGQAVVQKVKVGPQKVMVTKKYYQDTESKITVPITKTATAELKIQATGRQVPVTITNSINQKPVKNVTITAGESKAATDDNGQTILVLSPESQVEKAVLSGEGFNNKDVEVTVTDSVVDSNKFTITPAGKIYFLSKRSGKIDVVKTNLDGTDRQTVLAGTGNEDEFSTSLLASRDWKYLALHSKRDDKAKMYLIDTSNDQLSTIDEGDATFTPIGWYEGTFVFSVDRSNVQYWQAKKQAIKSFNASSKFLKTVDETQGEGSSDIDYAVESFGKVYILENELGYAKTWSADYYSGGKILGKKNTINSVRPDGSDKKTVKEFDTAVGANSYIDARLYEPQEVYFQVSNYTQNTFYEYENGKLEEAPTVTIDEFNKYYPTFLISPKGVKTFWYEPRDGKNTLFIGDKNAEEPKEIATLSDYTPYGWFTDDYVLESKSGSELYIASPYAPDKLLKISDYHKPSTSFAGYGYGYGGL